MVFLSKFFSKKIFLIIILFCFSGCSWFIKKESKIDVSAKNDWKVDLLPGQSKETDSYDVIIVGSGIGGLSCAALLSTKGYKVLVIEKYGLGGYCTSFERDGFVFNAGVEDVSGLSEIAPVTYLLKKLNLDKDKIFGKNIRRYIINNKTYDFVGTKEDTIKKLSDIFPTQKGAIKMFFDEADLVYKQGYSEVQEYGVPFNADMIIKYLGKDKFLEYPKTHANFIEWHNNTYKNILDKFFTDEKLKKFLCSLLGYIGTQADKTSAISAVYACLSYFMYNGYYIKGGSKNFAVALADIIKKNGGTVLVGPNDIDRYMMFMDDNIIVNNGSVDGVSVDAWSPGTGLIPESAPKNYNPPTARRINKIFKSKIVVANVNAKTLFNELISKDKINKSYVDAINELKMSKSIFAVYLGVDIDLSGKTNIITDLDNNICLVINSSIDKSMAPKSKSSLTILSSCSYDELPKDKTTVVPISVLPIYNKYIEDRVQKEIEKVKKIIPDIDKHIVVKETATPIDYKRYTDMPEGAIYGFEQSMGGKRPYFKTPIKGLYLASSSTLYGGGIEAVVMAGITCAQDICDWKL